MCCRQTKNANDYFDKLKKLAPDAVVIGYKELDPNGVSSVQGTKYHAGVAVCKKPAKDANDYERGNYKGIHLYGKSGDGYIPVYFRVKDVICAGSDLPTKITHPMQCDQIVVRRIIITKADLEAAGINIPTHKTTEAYIKCECCKQYYTKVTKRKLKPKPRRYFV